MGETLHAFQKRVRLERALRLMAHSPRMQLTDVARACGFSDSSSFSRAFREQYGVSPRKFDLGGWKDEHRTELGITRLPAGENPDGFSCRIQTLPPRTLATIRVTRPFEPGRVSGGAERLMAWADAEGIEGRWYGWMWEDPEIVPLTQCRYDVGVEVPLGTRTSGEVFLQEMPAMAVAVLTIVGDIEREQRGLDWLYGTWLPSSRREPAALPSFEAWHGRPFADGFSHFALDIHLPVQP